MAGLLTGKIQTVLGLVNPDEMGFTLPHEHILFNPSVRFKVMDESMTTKIMSEKKVSIETIGWIRYHLFENRDNLILDDEETMIKELQRYQRAGGESIIDVTSWGLGRDPMALARVSRATRLHIVMGSGYYTMDSGCAATLKEKTEDEIREDIVKDIKEGVNGICAGIIGEIGADSWPLHEIEKKSLRAAARAQRATGAALTVHPGRLEESALQILKLLDKAGADMSRVVMEHLDRTEYSFNSMIEMAKTGCYLEFDCFGLEGYYPRQYGVFACPNDAMRVKYIIKLIDKGYLNQVLISTDMSVKIKLSTYGGPGYSHIIDNFRLSKLMEQSFSTS